MAGGALRCRATAAALRGPQQPTADGVAEILPKGGHCPRLSFGAQKDLFHDEARVRRLVLFDSHKIEHEARGICCSSRVCAAPSRAGGRYKT